MMSTAVELERLIIRLVGDGSSYKAMLDEAEAQSRKAAQMIGAQMTKIGHSMKSIGTWMTAGVTLPIVGMGLAMLKVAADAEKANIQFDVMLGRGKGQALMSSLREFTQQTPFEFTSIRDATKSLLAFGFAQENVIPSLKLVGDVASGTGMDIEQLSFIYARASGMGKMMGRDLLQLSQAGFPVQELAKTMGVGMDEFRKQMAEGDLTFSVLEETFKRLTSDGGRFNNMMEQLMGSLSGQLSNLKDKFTELSIQLGTKMIPYAMKLMVWVSEAILWFGKLSSGTQDTIMVILGLAAAIGPLLIVFGSLISIVGGVIGIFSAVGFGGIAVIIAGITLAAVALLSAFSDMTPEVEKVGDGIKSWDSNFGETQGKFADLLSTIKEIADVVNRMFGITGEAKLSADLVKVEDQIQKKTTALIEAENAKSRQGTGRTGAAAGWVLKKLGFSDPTEDIKRLEPEIAALMNQRKAIQAKLSKINLKEHPAVPTPGNLVTGKGGNIVPDMPGIPEMLGLPAMPGMPEFPAAPEPFSMQGMIPNASSDEGLTKELEDLKKEAESITKAARTPSEIFGEETAQLDKLLSKGLITIDTYNRAYSESSKKLSDDVNKLLEESPLGQRLKEAKEEREARQKDREGKLDAQGKESFRQINTNRISIAGLASFGAPKKQEVEAKGVESRLDRIAGILQKQPGFALVP